jgi:hypothetical protein
MVVDVIGATRRQPPINVIFPVPIAAIAAGLDERHTSYALTMSSPR